MLGATPRLSRHYLFSPQCFWSAVLVAAATQNLSLDYGHVVEAAAGILPIALVDGSVGYLIADLGALWRRDGCPRHFAGGIVCIQLFGIFSWPDWTQRLSIFTLYGSPLVKGPDWGAMIALLAVAVVALGLATWRFARKDIAA